MSTEHIEIFRGCPPRELEQALDVFRLIEVDSNTALIQEGDTDPTLAIIDQGELAITTGSTSLGRAGTGDVVGEMALFGGGLRSATVTSAVPSRLLVLDIDGYDALRGAGNPVAASLEEHTMHALTDRLRRVGDRIASIATGEESEDVTPGPGFFDKVASALGSGGMVHPGRLDGAAVLGKSRLFEGVPKELLDDVASHFYPVGARQGHFLCTEGATGNEMFILASGEVEVMVSTRKGRVERLATLEAGDAMGMCALLQQAHPRMASCVARSRVTALSMAKMAFAELISQNTLVASVLRVAMIRSMARQLSYANAQLSQLDMRRQSAERADRNYEAVMRAAAAMESHGDYLGEEASDLPYLL